MFELIVRLTALTGLLYFFWLTAIHGLPWMWSRLKTWWTSTARVVAKLDVELVDLEKRIAALEAQVVRPGTAAPSGTASAPAASPAPSAAAAKV
jgi:hypothetical protein